MPKRLALSDSEFRERMQQKARERAARRRERLETVGMVQVLAWTPMQLRAQLDSLAAESGESLNATVNRVLSAGLEALERDYSRDVSHGTIEPEPGATVEPATVNRELSRDVSHETIEPELICLAEPATVEPLTAEPEPGATAEPEPGATAEPATAKPTKPKPTKPTKPKAVKPTKPTTRERVRALLEAEPELKDKPTEGGRRLGISVQLFSYYRDELLSI